MIRHAAREIGLTFAELLHFAVSDPLGFVATMASVAVIIAIAFATPAGGL